MTNLHTSDVVAVFSSFGKRSDNRTADDTRYQNRKNGSGNNHIRCTDEQADEGTRQPAGKGQTNLRY